MGPGSAEGVVVSEYDDSELNRLFAALRRRHSQGRGFSVSFIAKNEREYEQVNDYLTTFRPESMPPYTYSLEPSVYGIASTNYIIRSPAEGTNRHGYVSVQITVAEDRSEAGN